MKLLDISVFLPVAYINSVSLQNEAVMDISSLSIESTYNGQQFDVEWIQNDTSLTLNAPVSTTPFQNIATELNTESNLKDNQPSDDVVDRMIRSTENGGNIYFNRYLQKVVETKQNQTEHSNVLSEILPNYFRNVQSTNDRILASLPANRTIYFDCGDSIDNLCLEGKFTVSNIKASNQPILITVNFTIDMSKVAKIMNDQRDIFVIRTSIELMRTAEEDK